MLENTTWTESDSRTIQFLVPGVSLCRRDALIIDSVCVENLAIDINIL